MTDKAETKIFCEMCRKKVELKTEDLIESLRSSSRKLQCPDCEGYFEFKFITLRNLSYEDEQIKSYQKSADEFALKAKLLGFEPESPIKIHNYSQLLAGYNYNFIHPKLERVYLHVVFYPKTMISSIYTVDGNFANLSEAKSETLDSALDIAYKALSEEEKELKKMKKEIFSIWKTIKSD
jgi:hypothetical protein